MKYLCLGYRDEQAWCELSMGQRQALRREMIDYNELLRHNGSCVERKGLPSFHTATTLRFEKGTLSISEGPFAKDRQQLGGIIVIEAMDLNRAIQLMSQSPCMRPGGSIEIRPMRETQILEEQS
jgi:hypothetical protein